MLRCRQAHSRHMGALGFAGTAVCYPGPDFLHFFLFAAACPAQEKTRMCAVCLCFPCPCFAACLDVWLVRLWMAGPVYHVF